MPKLNEEQDKQRMEKSAEQPIKLYLGGGEGIDKPVDALGNEISIGDKLSWDFHDDFYQKKGVDDWMRKAIYIVEAHPNGKCLCGRGIAQELYLHDFRFKCCEIVK
ncbi:hypothetical protein [Aliivibrio salmonicida]|uniref:hypothetical protein n=1 Tax=Aliivibrio salmonicida TaxID=40269 RepID=UPI003D0CACFD